MHDAPGAGAQPFQPDRHGEADRDLHGDFRQRGRMPKHVAVVHVVADLQHCEQHAEQDRGGIGHARRHIVGPPPQQIAGIPERHGRDAISVEKPIEDRGRADIATDDARLVTDAHQHNDDDGGRQIAQCGQGPPFRNPGDAGDH